ncbi:Imm21 family immunity protein [Streptomyces fructofermentans]|nr:Imm21 family immunity protein [Streptomyces fructofermentans]
MARYTRPRSTEWVESGGGPLIAIPDVVLPFWSGARGDELACDHDRAFEVDGLIGLLPVGNLTALVLGDDPAATTYLPEHGTFVRSPSGVSGVSGASGRAVPAGVAAALTTAVWARELEWRVPGPVVLFDAAWPGDQSAKTGHLRIDLRPGRYAVRAARTEPGPGAWTGLVQLRHLGP